MTWWMNRYGAKSPKRQWAWANSPAILRLDVGWKKIKKRSERACHIRTKLERSATKDLRNLKERSFSTEILVKPFGSEYVICYLC